MLRLARDSSDWKAEKREVVQTTLDLDLQALSESEMDDAVRAWEAEGAHNASVIVIDRETAAVLAWGGSTGYFDKAHTGAIDYTSVNRSPGSTLKLFLVAHALDRGVITSSTIRSSRGASFRKKPRAWSHSSSPTRRRGCRRSPEAARSSIRSAPRSRREPRRVFAMRGRWDGPPVTWSVRGLATLRTGQVTSPPSGVSILRDSETPASQATLALAAVVDPPAPQVVRYVDGKPWRIVGHPYATRWPLAPGPHVFRATVPRAAASSASVHVTVE